MQVHGEITKFRNDIGFGVIKSEDGRKFRFTKSQLLNSGEQLVGANVDFFVVANRPTEIIVMQGSPWTVFGSTGRA